VEKVKESGMTNNLQHVFCDAYQKHRGKYGSPRIHAELKAQGIQNGAKTSRAVNARKTVVCREKEEKSPNHQQSPSFSHRVSSAQT
jgi:hypothetical protein